MEKALYNLEDFELYQAARAAKATSKKTELGISKLKL